MGVASQTKVGDLDCVHWWCRRRSDQGRVTSECTAAVLWSRSRDKNVFRLNVAMEEVVMMNVLEAGDDLVENTLDARSIHVLVISSLHQLIKISIHVLHCNV